MVNEALNSLSNYFLLRNGEFGLALIREIEKLKISRLTARNTGTRSASGVIREQDLQLALLRASLGTSAQQDPTLTRLKMTLPTGPLRPLLPSLSNPNISAIKPTQVKFNDVLLGTPTVMIYHLQWPLDLFLSPSDLQIYADLFAYISALRKVQNRVLECWVWLSNSQRQRRKWTGLGEGGTEGDDEGHRGDRQARQVLLRCGWGLVRDMLWFLDTLLAYVMSDVVEVELKRLREKLHLDQQSKATGGGMKTRRNSHTEPTRPVSREGPVQEKTGDTSGQSSRQIKDSNLKTQESSTSVVDLDFTTLRAAHSRFLHILLTASLLAHPACASTVRTIMEVCERFVAQVERWGGDVLPGLLDEGSISLLNADGQGGIGSMVRERWKVVHDVNEALVSLLETFYEQLSTASSTQVQANVTAEMTMNGMSSMMPSAFLLGIQDKANGSMLLREKREGEGEVRRHIERLLLRLDFNGALSKWKADIEAAVSGGILQDAGLA
ncbi:hypothetical protein FRC18_006269 [Serendipita sp. 400]|nr:hypothetical protein FRC18_006269 [Serendipita sp. 400]